MAKQSMGRRIEQLESENRTLVAATQPVEDQIDEMTAVNVGVKLTRQLAGVTLQSMDRGLDQLTKQIALGSMLAEHQGKQAMLQLILNRLKVSHAQLKRAERDGSPLDVFGARASMKLTRDQLRQEMLLVESNEQAVDSVMAEIDAQFA